MLLSVMRETAQFITNIHTVQSTV